MKGLINTGGAGSSGHVITDGTTNFEDREYLQFDDVDIQDDSVNNKTIIKPQFRTVTEAEWNLMSPAERNNPNVYWVRPWMASNEYSSDMSPVGTVISVSCAKTEDGATDSQGDPIYTPSGIYPPESDYLVCDGAPVYINQYPKLAEYFEQAYGTKFYFNAGQTDPQDGTFAIPDWSADFPENGILCIKAQISSTTITFAEVDDESVTEGNVWSAQKVSDYLYHMRRRVRKNITSEIQKDNGARLIAAIAEQDLAKYGFAIGDYFESPTTRTLKQQSSNASTETNTSVKLRYHLADMNTYYGGYSSYSVVSTPHIGIVVDTMVTRQWHTGDASSVGYNGSTLQAFLQGTSTGQVMTAIKADMIALFGGSTGLEHLLSHQKLFTNTFANWAWQADKYISALTESEISGHTEWSGNIYQEGEAVKPLELFRKFRWNEIFGNAWIWLRNLYTASSACRANGTGTLGSNGVTAAGLAAGLILFH